MDLAPACCDHLLKISRVHNNVRVTNRVIWGADFTTEGAQVQTGGATAWLRLRRGNHGGLQGSEECQAITKVYLNLLRALLVNLSLWTIVVRDEGSGAWSKREGAEVACVRSNQGTPSDPVYLYEAPQGPWKAASSESCELVVGSVHFQ